MMVRASEADRRPEVRGSVDTHVELRFNQRIRFDNASIDEIHW